MIGCLAKEDIKTMTIRFSDIRGKTAACNHFWVANHLQHYTIFCCTLYHVLLWQIDALQALKTFIFSPFRKIVIAWFTSVSPYFEKELDRKIARCDIQMGLDFSMSRAQEVPFPRISHPILLTFPK